MSEESKKETVGSKSKLKILVILGILLFAGGAALSGFIIKEQPEVLGLSAQSEITSLISRIGKLIVLPSNELPTATTISDVSKLKKQFFFRNVKKDDKLLVYTNAKWAVLYRPTENKIIEAGAFTVDQQVTTPSPSVSPTPMPSATPAQTATPTPSVSPSPTLMPNPTLPTTP